MYAQPLHGETRLSYYDFDLRVEVAKRDDASGHVYLVFDEIDAVLQNAYHVQTDKKG